MAPQISVADKNKGLSHYLIFIGCLKLCSTSSLWDHASRRSLCLEDADLMTEGKEREWK